MNYEIIEQLQVSDKDRNAMYSLMLDNYEGIKKSDFLGDLSKKDYVIILKSEDKICGFSTFAVFDHEVNGQKVRVAFSGDTVIVKAKRNSRVLPVSFGVLMNRIEQESSVPLYWMLISKGFRTYRFLPVYFKEFYPVFNQTTPKFEQSLIDSFGATFFGSRFNREAGIIASNGQYIKSREEDLEIINKRKDAHIQFFNEKNPQWQIGDELVCILKYERKNLNTFIIKVLDREEQQNASIVL